MNALTVLIPTYNRLHRLQHVLDGLAAQSAGTDGFEVVVVSDGSTDGTDDYLRAGDTPLPVRAVTQPNQGPAVARNRGLAEARGELVLFLDDDVVPGPRLVAEHLRSHHEHGDRAVVVGPMLTPDDFAMSPWTRWEQAMLYKQYRAMLDGEWEPTARQFYTGNASVRRCHLEAVGGFDPSFRRAEDVELAYRLDRLGLQFCFNPEAAGLHYAERSYASWIGNASAYGENDVKMSEELGQDWLLPTIWDEFDAHHPLVRLLVRTAAGRPRRRTAAVAVLRRLAGPAGRVGLEWFSQAALSGIYNLAYYEAVFAAGGQPVVGSRR